MLLALARCGTPVRSQPAGSCTALRSVAARHVSSNAHCALRRADSPCLHRRSPAVVPRALAPSRGCTLLTHELFSHTSASSTWSVQHSIAFRTYAASATSKTDKPQKSDKQSKDEKKDKKPEKQEQQDKQAQRASSQDKQQAQAKQSPTRRPDQPQYERKPAPPSQTPKEVALARADAEAKRGEKLMVEEKFEQAEQPLEVALDVRRQYLPPDDPALMKSMIHLSFTYQSTGKRAQAQELYEQTLTLQRKFHAAKPGDLALTLFNYAEVLAMQTKVPEAEAHIREALPLIEEGFGKDHAMLAMGLANLAGYLGAQHKYEDGLAAAQKSLEILERTVGADHEYTQAVVTTVVKLLSDLGREKELDAFRVEWKKKSKAAAAMFMGQELIDMLPPAQEEVDELTQRENANEARDFDPDGFVKTPETIRRQLLQYWDKCKKEGRHFDPALQEALLSELSAAGLLDAHDMRSLYGLPPADRADQLNEVLSSTSELTAKHITEMAQQGDVDSLVKMRRMVDELDEEGEPPGALGPDEPDQVLSTTAFMEDAAEQEQELAAKAKEAEKQEKKTQKKAAAKDAKKDTAKAKDAGKDAKKDSKGGKKDEKKDDKAAAKPAAAAAGKAKK